MATNTEPNSTYSIFSISDYKGGELHTETNVSLDYVHDYIIEHLMIEEELEELGLEKQKQLTPLKLEYMLHILYEQNYSLYAGGAGFTAKVFQHKRNKLKEVEFPTFFEGTARQLYLEIQGNLLNNE